MSRPHESGASLVVGLILLTLVTLLGLAGASAAHVERLLAQHEAFRENASSAASAGIEMAIREIVSSPEPYSVPASLVGQLPDSPGRFETTIRFAGFEESLPQETAAHAVGAHFDIVSTGYSGRAADRQLAEVMWIIEDAGAKVTDCTPLAPRHCHRPGELERVSWHREPVG